MWKLAWPQERAYATMSADQKAVVGAPKAGKGLKGKNVCDSADCDPKPLSEGVCKVLCPTLEKGGNGDDDDDGCVVCSRASPAVWLSGNLHVS